MNSLTRKEKRSRAKRKASLFGISAIVAVVSLVGFLWITKEQTLDSQGCPKENGPSREVVVLLDTSDPLSEKHQAELRRILREMTSPNQNSRHSQLEVQVGERVSFYVLQSQGVADTPIEQLCNPGGRPSERTALDALKQGSVITSWRWHQFVDAIENLFPENNEPTRPASPLLETIAVLMARHAPSERSNAQARPAHLIVISDLLQHTTRLSHYGAYSEADQLPRELIADLSHTSVSLFRLEREKYERFQTPEHFYWWTDWVEVMGGRVVWQQPL